MKYHPFASRSRRRLARPGLLFARGLLLGALAGLGATAHAAESYAFTVFAGAPALGTADGAGAVARFHYPVDTAVDAAGNVYVSDYDNFTIRKIATDGTVSTLAGIPGGAGYANGSGSQALFNVTFGLATYGTAGVLVADAGNQVIRLVAPDGTVTTIAGTGVGGYADGPVAAAQFNGPEGLAVDAAGNIYVADVLNQVIRKISPAGVVSTVAGLAQVSGSVDGVGASARFHDPTSVAVDSAGNLYVSDSLNHTIRKITPDGNVTTLAGLAGVAGAADGTGSQARFNGPAKIVVDAQGNLFVADRYNSAIREISPSGSVATVAGGLNSRGFADGLRTAARFFFPQGLAIDGSGNLWVGDTMNNSVRKIAADGTVTTVAGTSGIGHADGLRNAAQFFMPRGVAVDGNGNVYVVDQYNQTIRKITADGTVSTLAGAPGVRGSADGHGSNAHFYFPYCAAVDADGNVYVSDNTNETIRKITPAGDVTTLAGAAGSHGSADGTGAAARFYSPQGVALDRAGNLIVADALNDVIRQVTPAGVVTTIAGQAGVAGTVDGVGAAAEFNYPSGVAVDGSGDIFVAEQFGSVVRKITPGGAVTTVAGQAGAFADIDGVGASARFDFPQFLTIDGAGNLYVTEATSGKIRKLAPDGTVTTIGGGHIGFSDGVGSGSEFQYPSGIAADTFGNLYIGDTNNGLIRKAGLVGAPNPASVIANLSVRANVIAGDRLIVGFVTNGPKQMLIRSVGPGLSQFVGDIAVAADPKLELYDGASVMVNSNDNWGGASDISAAADRLAAFHLDPNSLDAALLLPINGLYTAQTYTTQTGLGLVEAYDTDSTTRATRLVNVSARYEVGTGANALVAGFVIVGEGPKTVLIRGSGPSLRALFHIADAMNDPLLKVYNQNQQVIATNDNWSPTLTTTFNAVSAFGFVPGSKDAALLLSLSPGQYSAELSGADGGTGNGLIEVYEIGN